MSLVADTGGVIICAQNKTLAHSLGAWYRNVQEMVGNGGIAGEKHCS